MALVAALRAFDKYSLAFSNDDEESLKPGKILPKAILTMIFSLLVLVAILATEEPRSESEGTVLPPDKDVCSVVSVFVWRQLFERTVEVLFNPPKTLFRSA